MAAKKMAASTKPTFGPFQVNTYPTPDYKRVVIAYSEPMQAFTLAPESALAYASEIIFQAMLLQRVAQGKMSSKQLSTIIGKPK